MSPRGRAFSVVRTPAMVRDYLSGEPFPEQRPEREVWGQGPGKTPTVEIDEQRGDYIASIYRHVRWRILELQPSYRWPRYHSMVTLVRHLMTLKLVEKTGETETSDILILSEDPPGGASPGDLRLDPARGFQQRDYYRLTPKSQEDLAWDNPMASIRAIYGIELVAPPRVPRPEREEEEGPVERPARRPRGPGRRRAPVEEAPAPVSAELLARHRQLEARRQALQEQAQVAAQPPEFRLQFPLELFWALEEDLGDFIELVRPHYRRFPLGTLLLDVDTLAGCTKAFDAAGTDRQREGALGACRRGAAVIAVDLALPLRVPDVLAEIPQEQLEELEADAGQEEDVEEEARPTPEVIAELTARWSTLTDRITGWSRPNSVNADTLLDNFVLEVADAHPELDENDLNDAIAEARSALETYQEETDPEERANAWEGFTEALGEVKFYEEEE